MSHLPYCPNCSHPTTEDAPLGCHWPHGGLQPPPALLWRPDDLPTRETSDAR